MLTIKVIQVNGNKVQITDGQKQMVVGRQQLDEKVKNGEVCIDTLQVKCLDKQRDKNNVIKSYLICDKDGKQMVVTSEQLKNAIYNYKAQCLNLTLTSDGRLIDTSEDNCKASTQDNTQVNNETQSKANTPVSNEPQSESILPRVPLESMLSKNIVKRREHLPLVLAFLIKENNIHGAIIYSDAKIWLKYESPINRTEFIVSDNIYGNTEYVDVISKEVLKEYIQNDALSNIDSNGNTIDGFRPIDMIQYNEYIGNTPVYANKIAKDKVKRLELRELKEEEKKGLHTQLDNLRIETSIGEVIYLCNKTENILWFMSSGYTKITSSRGKLAIAGTIIPEANTKVFEEAYKKVHSFILKHKVMGAEIHGQLQDEWYKADIGFEQSKESNSNIIIFDKLSDEQVFGDNIKIVAQQVNKGKYTGYKVELTYKNKIIATVFNENEKDSSSIYGHSTKYYKYMGIGYDIKTKQLGFVIRTDSSGGSSYGEESYRESKKYKLIPIYISN